MKRLLLAVCLVFAAIPAGAVDLVKSYSYFTVDGATLDELDRQLQSRGPEVQTSGHKHPGATRMQFISRLSYAESSGSCRVAKAKVILKVEVILPRWRPRGKPEQDVRIIWATLSDDIKRHEEMHVDIARNHARELEQALKSLGPEKNCAAVAENVKAATAAILKKHDLAQIRFDRIENINFESRFQRLLDYRLQRMEGGNNPAFGQAKFHR